jgi:hypothetical protein
MRRRGQTDPCWWWQRFLLVMPFLLTSCVAWPQPVPVKPSPDPQSIRAILNHYPGGSLQEERTFLNGGDPAIRWVYHVRTTTVAAVAYYDPLLQDLGFEQSSYRGAINEFTIEQAWAIQGACPYHLIAIAAHPETLDVMYVQSQCR